VISGSGWTEQFCKDGFERVGPDLIPLLFRVQLVALVHHAVKQSPVVVCESIVHVQKQGFLSIGEARKIVVDTIGLGVLASAICFPYLAVSCHSFPQPLPVLCCYRGPSNWQPLCLARFP